MASPMAPPTPLLLLLLLAALLAPCAARPPSRNASAAPTADQVTVGVVLPERELSCPWSLPRVAPALSLALEALQPQLRLAGLAVRTAFAATEDEESWCEIASFLKAAELKGSHDPDLLLGMNCLGRIFPTEPFAQYWRLPLLQAGLYLRPRWLPGEVYLGPLAPSLAAFQTRLFQRFNWTARVLMVGGSGRDCWSYRQLLGGALEGQLTPGGPRIYFVRLAKGPGELFREIQSLGRVVFVCGALETFHQFMHLAHAQNMTNGDYVFFYIDYFGESLRAEGHPKAWKPWQSEESQDTGGLREAFQTALVIAPHEPQTPEYQRFKNQLVLCAQRDFGVAINDSMGHLVAGCYHDGLLLYLRALNETLREGGTKRNTSHILGKMRSLQIQGVTGTVSINSDNEREMDSDLWAMRDVETGEFQVVGHYIVSEERINWTGDILWKKGAPPLDNPPCVFNQDDPSCVKPNLETHLSSDQDTGEMQFCQWSIDGSDNLVNLGSTFF